MVSQVYRLFYDAAKIIFYISNMKSPIFIFSCVSKSMNKFHHISIPSRRAVGLGYQLDLRANYLNAVDHTPLEIQKTTNKDNVRY